MRRALFFGVLGLALGGCDDPPAPDYVASTTPVSTTYYAPPPDAISQQIRGDMTENQVVATIGQPTRVAQQTCGQTSGTGAWRCKVYNYDGQRFSEGTLVILFSEYRGAWLVNSWRVIR